MYDLSYTQKTDESGLPKLIARALIGSLAGLCVSALLALILSAILVNAKDPGSLITPLAYGVLLIGSLSCGIAVRRLPKLAAVVSGVGYVLCLWLTSLLVSAGDADSSGLALKLAGYSLCVVISFLGAVMGKRKGKRIKEGKNSPTAALRRQLGKRQ